MAATHKPLCTPILPAPGPLLSCIAPSSNSSSSSASDFRLELNEELLVELCRVIRDREVIVLTVVGPYRSGKSFLLNRLFSVASNSGASTSSSGFAVSHSTRASTKGIWVWAGVIKQTQHRAERVVVVLDTEGMGDAHQVSSHDQDLRRLLVATLLSSHLVFNIPNVLNDDTLKMLSFVAELPKIMDAETKQSNAKQSNSQPAVSTWQHNMPSLTFLLRDFTKDLSDYGGDASRYVKELLQHKATDGNSTCNSMLQTFRNIDGATLVSPVLKPEIELKELNQPGGPDKYLRPEFNQQLERFWQKLFDNIAIKHVECVPLTGANMAEFVRALVSSVNQPSHAICTSFPSLREIMENTQLDKELKLAIATYEKEMRSISTIHGKITLPVDEAVLLQFHASCKQQSLERVNSVATLKLLSALVTTRFLAVVDRIQDAHSLYGELKARNVEASRALCSRLADGVVAAIQTKVQDGSFKKSPEQFDSLLASLLAKYDRDAKGPMKPDEKQRLLSKESSWRASIQLQVVEAQMEEAKRRSDEMARAAEAMKQQLEAEKKRQKEQQENARKEQERLETLRKSEELARRQALELHADKCKERMDDNRRAISAEMQAQAGGPSTPSPWVHLTHAQKSVMRDSGSFCPWCPQKSKGLHPVSHVGANQQWTCKKCSKKKTGIMNACVECGSIIDSDCYTDYICNDLV